MQTKRRVGVSRKRFTVHEFHRMGEAGIFREGERVELMDGEVVEMNPIGSRHAACVGALTRIVGRQLTDDALLWVQNPIRLDESREPQPDVAIIRSRDYRQSLPGPDDTLLIVEVSDTTLAYDRDVKLPLYAQFGIEEVWVVNLEGEEVERHTEPAEAGYRRTDRKRRGENIESATVAGVSVPVADIL